MRCALLDGNLAQPSVKNGWQGLVVYGCIRDSTEIRDLLVGIQAMGLNYANLRRGCTPATATLPSPLPV